MTYAYEIRQLDSSIAAKEREIDHAVSHLEYLKKELEHLEYRRREKEKAQADKLSHLNYKLREALNGRDSARRSNNQSMEASYTSEIESIERQIREETS